MRRDRFVEQYQQYVPHLISYGKKCGLTYDESNDVLGECIARMLKNKTYVSIEPPYAVKAYMHTAIYFKALEFRESATTKGQTTVRFPDPEIAGTDPEYVTVLNQFLSEIIAECPFCFIAHLNEYGACAMCGTIVPSHYRNAANVIRMTEASLAVVFEYDTHLDVRNAVAQLTPYEQMVVKAIGMGNETLDSLALSSNINRMALSRTWLKAKEKLQGLLHEYGQDSVSKHSKIEFQRVLESLMNQEDTAA